MGIVIRKSLATTLFSYLGVVVGYLNILYFFPKYLTPAQIGLYRLILDSAILLAPFAQSGIMQGIMKFYPTFNKESNNKKDFILFTFAFSVTSIFIFSFVLLFFQAEILSLLQVIFKEDASLLEKYYQLLIYLTIILSFIAVYEGFARANLGVVVVNFLKDVYIRTLTAISIFLYFRQIFDFNNLLYSLLIIYGSASLILFIHTTYKYRIYIRPQIPSLPIGKIKEIIKYSFFMVLSAGSTLVVGKIDSLMVSAFLGFSSNGIYSTLFYVAIVIEIPKRAIAQIAIPLYSKAFAENNLNAVKELYQKTALNQLIVGLLLFIGIVTNLHNLFFFIPNGEVFAVGKWVIILVGTSRVIDMAAGANGELIIMSRYFKVNVLLISSLAVLTILTNILFIPLLGMNGAALASLLSLLLFNLFKLLYIYRKYRLFPFTKPAIIVLIIGAISFVVGWFLPVMENPYVDLFVRSALVSMVYSFLIYFSKASADINNFIAGLFSKWNNRK
jgi:O-antigen/teichoic acid export membrane protein